MSSEWDVDVMLENGVRYIVANPLVAFVILIFIHIGFYFLLRSQPPSLRKANDLKISELYVYPIKSLKGTQVPNAIATKNGFEYDRRFMLLRITPDGFQNMQLSKYSEMVRFTTAVTLPGNDNKNQGSIAVDFQAAGSDKTSSITIPLTPVTDNLEPLEVNLYQSITKAFKMPSEFNAWFSSCFGFEVVLAYLGDHRRDVLFEDLKPNKKSLWFSSRKCPQIGFADVAPYLVVSKTSVGDVSKRLPNGETMDVVKFRPNIVLEGAESAWEEDFWARLQINGELEMTTAHNCGRCKSINIDYSTGKAGVGPAGEILKKLQSDRRVDAGIKYSPVFGRYSFWSEKNGDKTLKVGDEVKVTRFNATRTTWSWKNIPGL